ncbi:MAG TPA: cupredoxin domain-containing protein, partial [Dehalococcoidia bacterium]|nr:cupredoxin domain-containing protein [Dehalococcoidia bacterium]
AAARGPVTINLTAVNLAFSTSRISATSGTAVTITLDNKDQAVPHDVGVNLPGVAKTQTCSGPCVRSISFTAPSPGTYEFFCSTHIDMKGTFVVTP